MKEQLFHKNSLNMVSANSNGFDGTTGAFDVPLTVMTALKESVPPSTIKRATSIACNQLSIDKLHKDQRKCPGSINTMLC